MAVFKPAPKLAKKKETIPLHEKRDQKIENRGIVRVKVISCVSGTGVKNRGFVTGVRFGMGA
jgi:hypothetical protein